MLRNNRIVLGVIGADVHAVGNKILEMVLKEAGFEVINLGAVSYTHLVHGRVIGQRLLDGSDGRFGRKEF